MREERFVIKGEYGRPASQNTFMMPRPGPGRVTLDEQTRRIIELLQQDGRMSFATMARTLGLPVGVVEKRVEALREAGVIQIVAVTDPLQLGFARQAMVGITVEGPAKPVAQALAAVPEVDYVVITTGGFDVLAEVVGRSDADLLRLVSQQIRSIPGVVAVQTLLYLELEKQSYAWGVHHQD